MVTALFFMGNDMSNKHPMLKINHAFPLIPAGFDQVSVIYYPSGECELDFVNHARRDFASETNDINIEWPFIEGFVPGENDWEQIGVLPLYT